MTQWTATPLRDLVTHVASGPSPTSEERPVRGEEWGLLKTTAVTWEHGWRAAAHKVPPREFWGNKSLEVHPGDVVITKAGPRHRVGVTAFVDDTPPRLMVSGKMVLLRPDPEKVVPSVMALALAMPNSQKYLDHRTTGMAESQVNFSNSALLSCPVWLPPYKEQLRIAEILDTIDQAVKVAERFVVKLNAVRAGLTADLLSGRVRTLPS
jgi:type I restriction enzyme S subunit